MSKLKELRIGKGLSKREIATMAGVTSMSYYRYEAGRRIPDAVIASRIAKALGTTVEELWGGRVVMA